MWVLFDLDGTLTQSEEGIWNCARHALRTMGRPEPDEATLRKFIGPPLMWSFQNLAGMAEEDALKREAEIERLAREAEKMHMADFVIKNNKTRQHLQEELEKVLDEIRKRHAEKKL